MKPTPPESDRKKRCLPRDIFVPLHARKASTKIRGCLLHVWAFVYLQTPQDLVKHAV